MNPPNESPEPQKPAPTVNPGGKLNAYRRQHAALRSHMFWLEGEIRLLEQADASTDEDPGSSGKKGAEDDAPTTALKPDRREPDLLADKPVAADLGRIRWGCALFAILGAALFLYLLFGLPYRIYN
jgi:hypothetical protein